MAALIKLSHFSLMAFGADGGGGLIENVSPLMLNGTGVICIDFVTILAAHFGSSHGAVSILIDDAGCGVGVAGDAAVVAVGKDIDSFGGGVPRGGSGLRTAVNQ